MGYQALLYCPEEKTARTLTQVLSDLDFTVVPCSEPFAAVKKLMGEHFDAVVVDCDNEQNAALLFKSARNSASNQASLAVAVVEGQAGVAKAFRIGANLVLTRPINVEQAKGTLRVARGLLRKGDSGKPAVSAPPVAPVPRSSAPPAPKAPSISPTSAAMMATPLPSAGQNAFGAVASAAPAAEKKEGTPAAPATPPFASKEAVSAAQFPVAAKSPNLASGAASAPAPARDTHDIPVLQRSTTSANEDDDILEVPSAGHPVAALASQETPVPAFTFGGANAPAESSSGSKKIILGVAAIVLVSVLAYAGWAHFSKHATSTSDSSASPVSSSAAAVPAAASQPKVAQPVPAQANPSASPSTTFAKPSAETRSVEPAVVKPSNHAAADEDVTDTANSAKHSSEIATKETSTAEPVEAPLVVKSGMEPRIKAKAAPPDAPAPSVIGMADTASGESITNLVDSGSNPKPVLQKMNVSQGVSAGLLLKKVDPVYPANAVRMRIEGSVLLDATISKTGNITGLKVVSGDPQLARAAADAVKRWKYAPYLLNGEPVEIQTQITIKFKLPN
jgi:TonB family protein